MLAAAPPNVVREETLGSPIASNWNTRPPGARLVYLVNVGDVNRWRCPHCDKTFKWASDAMARHLIRQHDDRPTAASIYRKGEL